MKRFEVVLLEPAARFVAALDPKLGAKVPRTLELLQHFGPQLPMPHARRLEGERLYELRVKQLRRAALLRDRYLSGGQQ